MFYVFSQSLIDAPVSLENKEWLTINQVDSASSF